MAAQSTSGHSYNGPYTSEHLNHVAFPLGGIGAGMLCLEGTGALSHVSLRGRAEVFNEPLMFAALCVRGAPNVARVLEGPVPAWKVTFPWGKEYGGAGGGSGGKHYGLPHCAEAAFLARFPFGYVTLSDPHVPLQVEIIGWSPFIPGDADSSSLPVAALEYRFVNPTARTIEAVFSFHARNFLATGAPGQSIQSTPGGFVLAQAASPERPWDGAALSAAVDDPAVAVNCAWFRGGWFDALTLVWKSVQEGAALASALPTEGAPSPGGSLYVPFELAPGAEKVIRLRLAWYVPQSDLCVGEGCDSRRHKPWYAGAFPGIEAVTAHWRAHYDYLRAESAAFSDCFYDTTLPPEVVEAVAANLAILKTPTVQRQADGRLWCWEGCFDEGGCCHGSCTHVWNYTQAIPHLFPDLERSLRQTEFGENQDARGHQNFRAWLPIRPTDHGFHAAADGQLGGVMKVYREWRISGDVDWLRALWPRVRQSLDYCIETWDPGHKGVLEEPHHNTYDIEFWGQDGMCTSFYLGALKAACAMAAALGEGAPLYAELLEKGRAWMESEMWNGEYFIQQIEWRNLRAGDPTQARTLQTDYSPEALEILRREGPKYQYGSGCLADGVLGAWLAACCGVDEFLDRAKVESHLLAVYHYNFRRDLSAHANPQRPTYALGNEGGLLLCTWPRGGEPTLPFPYSNEVWTGVEYQVAAHLMMLGHVEEGLEIVRAVRARYDGRVRDPFDEYECGHWYARAMSSYALLQGLTGARYDAVEKTLYVRPNIPGDFRAFFCAAGGYGIVGVRAGEVFLEVKRGAILCKRIIYEPAGGAEERATAA